MNTHTALALLCLSTLALATTFPDYTVSDHPFYTDPQFSSLPKSPVILRRYFRRNGPGTISTNGVRFIPHHASYDYFDSNSPFATNLDALHVQNAQVSNISAPAFLTVDLNGPARVILLLSGTSFGTDILPKLNPDSVTGLPAAWSHPKALREHPGATHTVPKSRRVPNPLTFPSLAAAVQRNFAQGEQIVLPHPWSLKVNGRKVERYVLLFAKQTKLSTTPQAFDYQIMPPTMRNRQTEQTIHTEPVIPNETCPDWVHDLYMVESRDPELATKDQEYPFWRTWHPPIDSFFWCYFDHEHGTFPGVYRPAFGYTAWKTPDNTTEHGRQDESHQGFKVLSFPLEDQHKFVVMTVHMHLSSARRFHTRHHTVIFAVLDEKWELELEFHMKADFGFAFASSNSKDGKRKQIPLTPEDRSIQNKLEKKGFLAGRRINVLNLDDDYPSSVDRRFAFRNALEPNQNNLGQIRLGVYEKWLTPLNTCTKSMKGQEGFIIDIQNPSTAKRTYEGDVSEPLQELAGSSEHRVIDILESNGPLDVALKHCEFFRKGDSVSLKESNGVFFTDRFFSKVRKESGPSLVRQFAKPGFGVVKIKPGRLNSVHGWSGHMEYETAADRSGSGRVSLLSKKLMNPENAIFAELN